jgi:hypothetical protein
MHVKVLSGGVFFSFDKSDLLQKLIPRLAVREKLF